MLTLRKLAKTLEKDDKILIYDGGTLVETVMAGEIQKSEDNFYTLSVVRVLELEEDGTFLARIGEDTNSKE